MLHYPEILCYISYMRQIATCCCIFLTLASAGFYSCAAPKAVPGDPVPAEAAVSRPAPPPEVSESPRAEMEMVMVQGGTFRMGSPRGTGLNIERPVHNVTLGDFLLGRYEVTQGQYFEITGKMPSSRKTNPEDDGPDGWMKLPVEMVSWYEALVFCNKLSVMENLEPAYRINGSANPDDWGEIPQVQMASPWNSPEVAAGAGGYRLPTESEWEYAARGGGGSKGHRYAGSDNPGHVSWYYANSDNKSHEIGQKEPNELGLYDMSGNVMEWCWDWHGPYTAEAKDSPAGPPSGLDRVIRGGGWSYAVEYCQVAHRHYNHPFYRGVNLGFRVARSL